MNDVTLADVLSSPVVMLIVMPLVVAGVVMALHFKSHGKVLLIACAGALLAVVLSGCQFHSHQHYVTVTQEPSKLIPIYQLICVDKNGNHVPVGQAYRYYGDRCWRMRAN